MIVELALLVAGSVMASEVLLRLPLVDQVSIIARTARSATVTLRSSRISDHWKETVLPAYSLRMGVRSLLFFLLLCLVALPVALVGVFVPGGMAHWFDVLMRPVALAILCVSSILYIVVRTRIARG